MYRLHVQKCDKLRLLRLLATANTIRQTLVSTRVHIFQMKYQLSEPVHAA